MIKTRGRDILALWTRQDACTLSSARSKTCGIGSDNAVRTAGEWTTVEHLCDQAGIAYAIFHGCDRRVYFVQGGGHRKIAVKGAERRKLLIDLDAFTNQRNDRVAAREMLMILATDLDCYEAGESLAPLGYVDAQRDGTYRRAATEKASAQATT